MPWFDVCISLEAEDAQAADRIFETLCSVVCQGEGEGDEHVCGIDWVGSLRPAGSGFRHLAARGRRLEVTTDA